MNEIKLRQSSNNTFNNDGKFSNRFQNIKQNTLAFKALDKVLIINI